MDQTTADLAREALSKSNLDFGIKIGIIVAAIAVVLRMVGSFFVRTRIEKIGIGGVECDPKDEPKAKPAAKPATKRKLFSKRKV